MKDVVIVGCGPTGALLANLLGDAGLDVLVLDKAVGVMEIPRAVHIDGETMRVIQSAGVANEVLALSRPGHGMHWVNAKAETMVIREGKQGLSDQGWHNDYYFHQPEAEKVIRSGFKRFKNVELIEGVEVVGHTQKSDSVALQVKDIAKGSITEVTSKYVVGCDGARSIVRQWIGDTHEDLGQHQAWLVVDAQLTRPLDLPEHTVQHCDPARPATSIYVHPLRRRWEIMLLNSDDLEAVTKPEIVWELLKPWIKPTQGVLERAATYVFHSLVSDEWSKGRLFIAGDAAHQTPPFLGQGLCAAARDAANLAWKLKIAVHQPSKAGILETYGSERKPHAREFIDLAVQMGNIIQVVDPKLAEERDVKLKAQGLTFQFPRPTLGNGVHADSGGIVGKISPQAVLPNGQWLDDVVGSKFSLLLDRRYESELSPNHVKDLAQLNIQVIRDGGDKTQNWLIEAGMVAALIRPDKYVFDACKEMHSLDSMITKLGLWV